MYEQHIRPLQSRVLRLTTRERKTLAFFCLQVNLTTLWLSMINIFYATIALTACNFIVFAMLLIARARVVSAEKSLRELDWETLANLTGDMATVKKSIQKLNNRLNGMEAKDPYSVLESLKQQASNVAPINQTTVKRFGG